MVEINGIMEDFISFVDDVWVAKEIDIVVSNMIFFSGGGVRWSC